MNIVFRVDASLHIGTGHVMRCLTLAQVLRGQAGGNAPSVCRQHEGHLMVNPCRQQGFSATALPKVREREVECQRRRMEEQAHASWLRRVLREGARCVANARGFGRNAARLDDR